MRMYKVTREESSDVLVLDCEETIVDEIEDDMKYWGYSLDVGEIIALPYNLRDLKVGETITYGPFTIQDIDVTEEEYKQLTEFDGW